MYSRAHDQPPSAPLPHSVTSKLVVPASGPTATHPLPLALFISSPPHPLYSSPSLASSLPPTRSYSQPQLLLKPSRAISRTPPRRLSRRVNLNVPMQRGPYSRETTDISDQELRQILESENISGLPAPYCLVPHYDGQVPLPQNALWPSQPPVASPSLAQQAAENALASNQLRQHPQAEHESNSSQSSPGGQNGSGASGGVDGAMAATAGNSSAQHTPVSSTASEASRRRTRTTLTPYQLRVLFRVWERTQYPSSDLRFRLATSLMMTPRNVQIWFQNQRQKTKERAEMRRRTHSPSNPSAILANMGAPPPHHQRHHPLASNQHSQAHMLEFHSHDGHISVVSMPGRSPPESPFRYTHGPPPAPPAIPPPPSSYSVSSSAMSRHHAQGHHESAAASGTLSMQTMPPAPGAYTMLTPPALYPHAFSQQQPQRQQQQQMPPLHMAPPHLVSYSQSQHHLHNHPAHSPSLVPPPPLPSQARTPHHLQHHQRHLSQPHLQHHTPARTPSSSLVPGSSQKHPSQQSYYPASQHGGDAHCVIPSPTTPTFVAEQSSLRQSPSPAMPRRRLPSPPLSLPIHLQHVASAQGSVSHSSQTVREHPGSRRSRLADILNPISSTTFASGLTNVARSEAIHQLGPLPSLGSVLANVQSEDCESPGTDPEETRCDGASSATTSTATDKWRPW